MERDAGPLPSQRTWASGCQNLVAKGKKRQRSRTLAETDCFAVAGTKKNCAGKGCQGPEGEVSAEGNQRRTLVEPEQSNRGRERNLRRSLCLR
ncbi:hypothetical protein NDU88_002726 [Pleurodeles waltl]|uniref:Uncharacterized protein n=1 Tax=Pleurodeles waltl TaxID=8319 RepID=A0AAV7KSY5_PLEWA|nr:hypothetical protein NDU88_002726 [Pleurodeles waltl]